MGQARHGVRRKSVRIEQWEIDAAKSVARSFKTFPDFEDLEAELLKRLLELKLARPEGVLDWRSFLARSLYNAAKNYIDRWNRLRRDTLSMDAPSEDEESPSLSDLLAAPDERIELKIEFSAAWRRLSPDLQKLWHLMAQEQGNVASVARRIGRSPRTVRDWVAKLHKRLTRFGLDGEKNSSAVFRASFVGNGEEKP